MCTVEIGACISAIATVVSQIFAEDMAGSMKDQSRFFFYVPVSTSLRIFKNPVIECFIIFEILRSQDSTV